MKCTLTSDTYLSAFGTVVRFFIIVRLHVLLYVLFRIRLDPNRNQINESIINCPIGIKK